MTVNFNEQLRNLVGVGLQDQEGQPLTLGVLAANCLLQNFTKETPLARKLELHALARIVVKGGLQELTPEALELIKESIGKGCDPLLTGAAFEIIGG